MCVVSQIRIIRCSETFTQVRVTNPCIYRMFVIYRTQQTEIGPPLSQIVSLSSGVVQGSVTGPLLFLLFSMMSS